MQIAEVARGKIINYVESSVWRTDGTLRFHPKPACFRVFSIGNRTKIRFDFEIYLDYGVFRGEEADEDLIAVLTDQEPRVKWCEFNYRRDLEEGYIEVYDNFDHTVARIAVRGYFGKQVDQKRVESGVLGSNVVWFG